MTVIDRWQRMCESHERQIFKGNRFHVKLRVLSPYFFYEKFADRFLAYTHRGKYILE